MKKEEFIRRYGKVAYEKTLQQSGEWRVAHPEGVKAQSEAYHAAHRKEEKAGHKAYRAAHPEKVKADSQELSRKGGKYYEQCRQYRMKGLPHAKVLIRAKHHREWMPFKRIIAPDSQIHHEWIPITADYRGVALVEADQHMHGYIDVIQILDGEITLLTEKGIGG